MYQLKIDMVATGQEPQNDFSFELHAVWNNIKTPQMVDGIVAGAVAGVINLNPGLKVTVAEVAPGKG